MLVARRGLGSRLGEPDGVGDGRRTSGRLGMRKKDAPHAARGAENLATATEVEDAERRAARAPDAVIPCGIRRDVSSAVPQHIAVTLSLSWAPDDHLSCTGGSGGSRRLCCIVQRQRERKSRDERWYVSHIKKVACARGIEQREKGRWRSVEHGDLKAAKLSSGWAR